MLVSSYLCATFQATPLQAPPGAQRETPGGSSVTKDRAGLDKKVWSFVVLILCYMVQTA